MDDFIKLAFGLLAPVPGILEGGNLSLALVTLGGLEQEIVVALGVERGVEVNQVNARIRELLPVT